MVIPSTPPAKEGGGESAPCLLCTYRNVVGDNALSKQNKRLEEANAHARDLQTSVHTISNANAYLFQWIQFLLNAFVAEPYAWDRNTAWPDVEAIPPAVAPHVTQLFFLQSNIMRFFQSMWQQAVEQGKQTAQREATAAAGLVERQREKELAAARDASEVRVAQLQNGLGQVKAERDAAVGELEQMRAVRDRMANKLDLVKGELEAARTSLKAARAEIKAAADIERRDGSTNTTTTFDAWYISSTATQTEEEEQGDQGLAIESLASCPTSPASSSEWSPHQALSVSISLPCCLPNLPAPARPMS